VIHFRELNVAKIRKKVLGLNDFLLKKIVLISLSIHLLRGSCSGFPFILIRKFD
jgi:uncharacterized membrane protein